MMQDMIGNRIAKGQYLYWKSKEMMVRVLEVAEPSVVGNDSLPVLTVIMQIPVMGAKPGSRRSCRISCAWWTQPPSPGWTRR